MELIFFDAKPKGKDPAPPALTVRPNGAVSLNTAAASALNAEAGEAATLAYDSAGQRWLLCHWPNGCEGKPQLRALTSKSGNVGTGLRFQYLPAVAVLFGQLSTAQQAQSSVNCPLDTALIQDAAHEGINFYALTLPTSAGQAPAPAPAKPATAAKQHGVGRGRYVRTASVAKGGSRG